MVSAAGRWPEGSTQPLVAALAAHLGAAEEDVAVAVFRSAVSSYECALLPPTIAIGFILALLADLGVTPAASLWTPGPATTDCLAAAGESAKTRRTREIARSALDGCVSGTAAFRVVTVLRWEQPFAVLVARSKTTAATTIVDTLIGEAAAALSPVLERDALYDRGVTRERDLVASGERRLVRLGYDLHDGPLQEIVAFAEDLRVARSHIEPLLGAPDRLRAAGCFDDLGARLSALDRDLRQIAHSVRSTTALERPLVEALRRDVDALSRAGIDTQLVVTGEVDSLTDSQKIVIYRVVQEALNNVRKHSGADSAEVRIRVMQRVISLAVSDSGRGIDEQKLSDDDRLGLAGVSERVGLLGGVVSIGTAPGGGTRVEASLPRWRSREDVAAPSYAATA